MRRAAVDRVLDLQAAAMGEEYLTRLRMVADCLEHEAGAICELADAEERPPRRMASAPAI